MRSKSSVAGSSQSENDEKVEIATEDLENLDPKLLKLVEFKTPGFKPTKEFLEGVNELLNKPVNEEIAAYFNSTEVKYCSDCQQPANRVDPFDSSVPMCPIQKSGCPRNKRLTKLIVQ